MIYLDSAHEIDETYIELCLYWRQLRPGGILMGDDYGWPAVRTDVDRFVADFGPNGKNELAVSVDETSGVETPLHMFGVYFNWFVRKPLDWKPSTA